MRKSISIQNFKIKFIFSIFEYIVHSIITHSTKKTPSSIQTKMNGNKNASFDELYEAINKTLARNGESEKIKSAIRAQVFSSLMNNTDNRTKVGNDDNHLSSTDKECNTPRENLLINEMINDYLLFNGCVHTASVFQTELGYDNTKYNQLSGESDRAIIQYELGLSSDEVTMNDSITNKEDKKRKVPILYHIISLLKKQKDQRKELLYKHTKSKMKHSR